MAGVKGRSGGARPGAGRKKKQPVPLTAAGTPEVPPMVAEAPAKKTARRGPAVELEPQPHGGGLKRSRAVPEPLPDALAGVGEDGFDPRPALEQVAMGLLEPSPAQMKALVALMPYVHTKRGEGGKKEQKQEAAQKVASRFAPAAPPRLVAVGGKKG